jgi:hypothetical protein
MAKTAQAMSTQGADQAGQTLYAQVKASVNQLDKKGKQRILQLLQKSIQQAPAATPAKPAAGAGAMAQTAAQLAKGGAANTTANTPVSKTNTAKPGNPNAAAPAAPAKAAPGATTTTPSGEKVIANPVATVGTKRATNIGEPTFDKQTGKALPGQAINAVRKKAEYGTGVLGAARKRIKAGAATTQTAGRINTRPSINESFSLYRKK